MPQLRDHLATLKPHSAIQWGFAALSGMSDATPDYQVMAAALLLKVMCDRTGLDPSQLLDAAGRVERDADDFFRREVKALRDYVDGEIKNWDPQRREVEASTYLRDFKDAGGLHA